MDRRSEINYTFRQILQLKYDIIEEGDSMIIYYEIELQKRKLKEMIDKEEPYDKILKQSQILDKLINKRMKELYNL